MFVSVANCLPTTGKKDMVNVVGSCSVIHLCYNFTTFTTFFCSYHKVLSVVYLVNVFYLSGAGAGVVGVVHYAMSVSLILVVNMAHAKSLGNAFVIVTGEGYYAIKVS